MATNDGSEKSDSLLVRRGGNSAHTTPSSDVVSTPQSQQMSQHGDRGEAPSSPAQVDFGGGLLPDDAKAEKRGGLCVPLFPFNTKQPRLREERPLSKYFPLKKTKNEG